MKQCPVCKTTYSDDSLSFCLADGVGLTSIETEAPTQQFQGATNPIRVNIAQDTSPTVIAPPTIQPPPPAKKGGNGLIIGLLVALLLLVVLGSAGVIGVLLMRDSGKSEIASNKIPNQTPTNLPNVNSDEQNKLKDKIANLEKQVQQQKNARDSVPTISNNAPPSTKTTARVNSPNDGFLALRTAPSAEEGDRILQIPHGSTVTVLGCLPAGKGKKGRWCRVNYDGNAGWAFDGFLVY